MPIINLNDRQGLVFELAFAIDDPVSIEVIELAHTIVRIFEGREGREVVSMHESLLQWSLQWPRIEKSPDTQPNNQLEVRQDEITEPCGPPMA